MPDVDISAYEGREQAFVKHCLLEKYLPDWGYKVGSAWDNVVYVDGFAGPWGVKTVNFADSSFGVAVSALSKMKAGLAQKGRSINVKAILVERSPEAYAKLSKFAANHTSPTFQIHPIEGRFATKIDEITELIEQGNGKTFKFVFLDPKGWKDIPMPTLAPFLKSRGCEVLVNLMARHAVRFLEEHDRTDSYNDLFGRQEVINILRGTPQDKKLSVILREYCNSLKKLCGFKYVSAAAILEPNMEAVRYFLVFGTNHLRGIEVFKNAEQIATRIQDKVRFETIFGNTTLVQCDWFAVKQVRTQIGYKLRDEYVASAMEAVIRELLNDQGGRGVEYSKLFAKAMEFPLVTPEDLLNGLNALPVKVNLAGSSRRKIPDYENDNDRVEPTDRAALERQIQKMPDRNYVDGELGL